MKMEKTNIMRKNFKLKREKKKIQMIWKKKTKILEKTIKTMMKVEPKFQED